jgi:hypothetical protein
MELSPRALLISLAAALACGVGLAATREPLADVYRIVGPDGKITYSDHPPKESGMRSTLVVRNPASGVVVLPPPITAITPWASLSVDARRGIVPAVPLGDTIASPWAITVPLVDSLSAVLARAELVRTMRQVCARNMPSAARAYDEAAGRWQERNSAVVFRAERVLESAFDGPRRNKIEANAHTRISPILTAVASASTEAKLQWCDQSVETIMHGALDLQGAGGAGAPVMSYTPRDAQR